MKTKIISTICGMPFWDENHIAESIKAGTSIFRMSTSFRTQQEEEVLFAAITRANKQLNTNVLIMQDLNNGVKRRLQLDNNIKVFQNEYITLSSVIATDTNICINWPELPYMARSGSIINVGDGEVALKIETITPPLIQCKVLNTGVIKAKKAITVEGMSSNNPTINEENMAHISMGAILKFDMVALSFVKNVEDIKEFWNYVNKRHPSYRPKLIAKIETKEAIANIDEILSVVDGIMIARGDLALQVAFTRLGVLQNQLIKTAKKHSKFCIVATQMFETIIDRYVPSRAEILDISYAVYQGVDALMLGPETCVNPDGIRAIKKMSEIINEVEKDLCRTVTT